MSNFSNVSEPGNSFDINKILQETGLKGIAEDAFEISQEGKDAQLVSANSLQEEVGETMSPKTEEKHKDIKAYGKNAKKTEQGEKIHKTLEGVKEKEKDKQGSAENFQQQHPELKSDKLLKLLGKLEELKKQSQANPEDILNTIKNEFKDPFLIDRAIEFLKENNKDDAALHQVLNDTQKQHYETNKGQIDAGKNINEISNKYASKTAQEPTELRDLYHDITNNPRETKELFNELAKKYPTLKDLQKILKFLYNALGKDLNSKGPSIESGELKNLIDESKTLQAISGVYRFFQARTLLSLKLFKANDVVPPQGFTSQTLAKEFITFLGDRYPTSDKLLAMVDKMGFHTTPGKIIIIESQRDAVGQISPRLYNSGQHKEEVKTAIEDASEKLYQDEEMELDQSNAAEYRSHLQAPDEPPASKMSQVLEDFYGDPNFTKKEKAA